MASKQGFDPAVLFLEGLSREITDDELKCLKRQCQSTGLVPPGGEIEKGSAGDLFMELYRKGLTSPGSHDIFISLLRAIPREDLITKYCSFFEGQSSGQTKYSSFFVGKVADFLRTFYRSRLSEIQPLPWCHDFFLPLNDVYTNLQFSEKDRRGRSSDSFRLQVSQLFENIMDSVRLPRRVRVEGPPGIGKSTFCHKVLYEWACGKLPQFSAAFLIEMRDYSGDIADAIIEQLPEEYQIMFSKDELWDQLLRDSCDLLFVLDGLDEIDRDSFENSDLDNLIQGKTMYGSTVIVTSRPHEFDAILKFCHPNLKITGYSSKDRNNFIVNYFVNRVEIGDKLVKEIQSKRVLSEICQTPLNTILLCVLLEENAEKLPDTVTELYASLVLSITKNYSTTRKGVEIDGDQLPGDISSKLCKLGEYAWQGLRKNRLIFRQSEISPEELLLTGFLTKNVGVSRIKRSKTCNFLHKTFQEYFAGLYISSKLNDTEAVGSDFHDIVEKELYTVGLFVCGLLGKEAKLLVKTFSKKLENKSDEENFELLLQQCLLYVRESGGHEAVASIVASELPTELSLISIREGCTLVSQGPYDRKQPFCV